MSFIAKNPLTVPEVESPTTMPQPGTRGLFAGKDGWYDIDSDGVVRKIGDAGGDIGELREIVDSLLAKSLVKTTEINLIASAWEECGVNQHSQVVSLNDITPYSKIDLQPTVEQLAIFYTKDITFVTENENGVVTIYCIGQKPINDYTMQATITEVEI